MNTPAQRLAAHCACVALMAQSGRRPSFVNTFKSLADQLASKAAATNGKS